VRRSRSIPAADKATASPKIRALATSLAEEWLKEQGVAIPAAAAPVQPVDPSFEDYLNSVAGAVHGQIIDLANAVPDLPGEFEQAAARITAIDPDAGRGQVLLDLGIFGDPYMVATRRVATEVQALVNLAIFFVLGCGVEWLFRKATGRVRSRLDALSMETVKDRLRVVALRSALAFGLIGAFVLGSVAAFFALDMDPVRRLALLSLLIVFIAVRVAVASGQVLLAPDNEGLRVIPMDTIAARFWCRRLTVFAGAFAFVWAIIRECSDLGFSFEGL
jgi:hypothetical protein